VITAGGAPPEVLTNVNRSYDKVSYELDDNAEKADDIAADDGIPLCPLQLLFDVMIVIHSLIRLLPMI
jgi:hypothetical protein